MQKAKETINKSIWSSIFDCQGLLQLEVVELWDLHYSCVHCSPSIVGGLDNALRLDQLSIIDGGNKLTKSQPGQLVSLCFRLQVHQAGGRWSHRGCQLPVARDPRAETDEPGGATLHNDFVQRVRERSVIISDRSLDCIIQLT